MRVFVYRNIRKQLFSIKALEGPDKGRVIGWGDEVKLYNPTFKVSEAGRQRVLREKVKNVHAGIVGEWKEIDQDMIYKHHCVAAYNPYKHDQFFDKDIALYEGRYQDVFSDYDMAVINQDGVDCYFKCKY